MQRTPELTAHHRRLLRRIQRGDEPLKVVDQGTVAPYPVKEMPGGSHVIPTGFTAPAFRTLRELRLIAWDGDGAPLTLTEEGVAACGS